MPDSGDLHALIDAAKQAAGARDYATAERYLREAVRRQDGVPAPGRAELANTLNNLGIVCDLAGKPDEAEQAYRRAYAIARQEFEPDHPLVTTSAQNLREFCEASGRSFEDAVISPRIAPPDSAEPLEAVDSARLRAASVEAPMRPRRSLALPLVAAGGAGVLLVIWLLAGRSSPTAQTASTGAAPAPAQPSAPSAGRRAPDETHAPAASTAPDAREVSPADPDRTGRPTTPVTEAPPSIVIHAARVCRSISTRRSNGPDWACDAAGDVVSPGPLVFYTRIAAPAPTTVQHLWYWGNRLHQRVELRIAPNPGRGYRTFSRTTLARDRTGEWRVELRSASGALLQEHAFTVR